MAGDVLSGLAYATRRFFDGAGTGYIIDDRYPRGLRRSAGSDEVSAVLVHRCNRRMTIPFDAETLASYRSANLIWDRLLACASLGCICDVRVVEDRDTGDEDLI